MKASQHSCQSFKEAAAVAEREPARVGRAGRAAAPAGGRSAVAAAALPGLLRGSPGREGAASLIPTRGPGAVLPAEADHGLKTMIIGLIMYEKRVWIYIS